ncbi:sodium-dependent transporter [Natranaerobius trueperi]|uniref:sodium-dependent transporter n=1 Tax=Natranaerobius trueperi TaxID=759412 RepID=UPI00146D7B23|nr:sodium-dependent transporter [Natranaerobius trueperi]
MVARESFGSRFSIIGAAIGMAVGTGNIWRFPQVAAEFGGGTFLFALTIAVFVWAVPLLMAEFYMGYKTRLGNLASFRDFTGKKYTWMGGWLAFCTLGIAFYYSVVTGWSLRYLAYSFSGTLSSDVDAMGLWNSFTTDPSQTILFHLIAVILAILIIYKGIKSIERAISVLLPSLFVVIIILAIRALTLPGAFDGIHHLFVPDWPQLLNRRVWLKAFTQAAWSTGAGWGVLMIYAVYSREKEDIGRNSFIIGFADVLAGFFAGTAVVATVYATAPTVTKAESFIAEGGTGLTFIYMTELLTEMPGGSILTPVFFLALSAANELSDMKIGPWWSWLIRLFPVMFTVLFGWWVYQSIGWYPETWWHPFKVESTGTMFFQWGIVAIIMYLLNDLLAENLVKGPLTKKANIESTNKDTQPIKGEKSTVYTKSS